MIENKEAKKIFEIRKGDNGENYVVRNLVICTLRW